MDHLHAYAQTHTDKVEVAARLKILYTFLRLTPACINSSDNFPQVGIEGCSQPW